MQLTRGVPPNKEEWGVGQVHFTSGNTVRAAKKFLSRFKSTGEKIVAGV